jgi:hypothetical protein
MKHRSSRKTSKILCEHHHHSLTQLVNILNCKIANKRFDWFEMERFNNTLGTDEQQTTTKPISSNAIWVFYLIETFDDWMAKELKNKTWVNIELRVAG